MLWASGEEVHCITNTAPHGPLQFWCQASRGVEDAIVTHLEKPMSHAKLVFMDFSSAFNTILPSILADILATEFTLEAGLILWIVGVLSCRIQQVRVGTSLWQNHHLHRVVLSFYQPTCTSTFPNRSFIYFTLSTQMILPCWASYMTGRRSMGQFLTTS